MSVSESNRKESGFEFQVVSEENEHRDSRIPSQPVQDSRVSNAHEEKRASKFSSDVKDIEPRQSRFGSIQFNSNFRQSRVQNQIAGPEDNGLVMVNGNITGSKLEGTGRLNSEEYVYYGQWSNSKFNGYGRITKRNFALYEGQFSQNRRDGHGVEIYVNSDIYIGQFKSDRKQGLGIYLFANGGYYYGFFEKNFRHGFGTLYNRANRQTYTGFWKQDMRHGRGIEFYKNGSKYDGFFDNDKRHGIGFMEYSKSLLYIGEWVAGKRDGLGKVEHNKKTVSGRFKEDQFVEPFFFNSGTHADNLLNNPIPKTVEEYLKQIDFKIKKGVIRGVGDIYAVLKESLVTYVLSLVETSVLRLGCYLKLKNIFSKSSRFEYVMDDLLFSLKYEPNPTNLGVYWDPALREILVHKHDFSWNKWEIEIAPSKVVFDETQSGDVTDVQIIKTDDQISLVITNELAIAKTPIFDGEGVVNNEGCLLRYYNSITSSWESTAGIRFFPFFLSHEDFNKRSLLSLNVEYFVGEFYFGNDNAHPKNLGLFLAMDQENTWYSVGVDSVGAFVLAGQYNSNTKSGQLLQKYFLEYQIEYELFLATDEKLQGVWKTTNMGGHFVLRKDTSFKFTNELAKVLHAVSEAEKNSGKVNLKDIEILKPYMEASILSVISQNAQGGVPEFTDHKEEIEDIELFEKYKRQQNPDNVASEIRKKTTLSNNGKRISILRQSLIQMDIDDDDSLNDSFLPDEEADVVHKARASLAFLNLKATEKMANIELQELNASKNQFVRNDFQTRLGFALRGLKQVVTESIKQCRYKFDNDSEHISWVGNFVALGKEQQIIFNNFYIIGDAIEGIFTDIDDVNYELAGSYSSRSKEFEIVGLSFDKSRSVKLKGEFNNFKLKGKMTKKPFAGPPLDFEIKLLGNEGKATVRFFSENSIHENQTVVIKVTDSYLYGIILLEKDYVFLNGVSDKLGYGIEISSSNKKIKNNILVEVKTVTDDKQKLSAYERKMVFRNDEMEIILHY